ncbi:MAG: alpha/beta hydrolase [Deltaproteobacteria bacterium]|nr:alpha/beta hydrolase [Deltaproteobacteria bacterium]
MNRSSCQWCNLQRLLFLLVLVVAWGPGPAFGQTPTKPSATEKKQAQTSAQKSPQKPAPKKKPKPVNKEPVFLVPPGYSKKKSYPLLVAMPYTGGTARNFVEYYLFTEHNPKKSPQKKWEKTLTDLYPDPKVRSQRGFVIMLPYGKGSTAEHSPAGFAAAIRRYESRILGGIQKGKKRMGLKPSKIVLAGHSLGGDLTWAMVLRNPKRFTGAFISGSRTSYWEDQRIEILAQRKFRIEFNMGEHEIPDRLNGLNATMERLTAAGVPFHYNRVPGVEHRPPSKADLLHQLEYPLFGLVPEPMLKPEPPPTEEPPADDADDSAEDEGGEDETPQGGDGSVP